jgi:hypothetical protein
MVASRAHIFLKEITIHIENGEPRYQVLKLATSNFDEALVIAVVLRFDTVVWTTYGY